MSCIKKRFFGVNLVTDEGRELAPVWADSRTEPAVLVFGGRNLVWRLIRNSSYRRFLGSDPHGVVPTEKGLSRQIKLATGCRVGPFPEFQSLVRTLARSEESGAAVYLLGKNAEGLHRMESNVRATFPGIRVVGRAVFHPISVASVTTAIRKASPRIVLSEVTTHSFFRWMLTTAEHIGPVLTIVAPVALGKMSGRRQPLSLMKVISIPLRLFLPLLLVAHRFVLVRRSKKVLS